MSNTSNSRLLWQWLRSRIPARWPYRKQLNQAGLVQLLAIRGELLRQGKRGTRAQVESVADARVPDWRIRFMASLSLDNLPWETVSPAVAVLERALERVMRDSAWNRRFHDVSASVLIQSSHEDVARVVESACRIFAEALVGRILDESVKGNLPGEVGAVAVAVADRALELAAVRAMEEIAWNRRFYATSVN